MRYLNLQICTGTPSSSRKISQRLISTRTHPIKLLDFQDMIIQKEKSNHLKGRDRNQAASYFFKATLNIVNIQCLQNYHRYQDSRILFPAKVQFKHKGNKYADDFKHTNSEKRSQNTVPKNLS